MQPHRIVLRDRHQAAQVVLGVADRLLASDRQIDVRGDVGFRLGDLDRRKRPDLDLLLVQVVEVFGQLERLLGDPLGLAAPRGGSSTRLPPFGGCVVA